jgi:hypothetical protein
MHPLTYFEEEYGNFNIAVTNMNELAVQSKDVCTLINKVCIELPYFIKNTRMDAASIEATLGAIETLIHQCRELLQISEESKTILAQRKK